MLSSEGLELAFIPACRRDRLFDDGFDFAFVLLGLHLVGGDDGLEGGNVTFCGLKKRTRHGVFRELWDELRREPVKS